MTHSSFCFIRKMLGNSRLWYAIALSVGLSFIALGVPSVTHAQAGDEVLACKAHGCVSFCREIDLTGRELAQCMAQCRKSCAPGDPAPLTVHPKYLIVSLVYAPPGCSKGATGTAPQCGTSNGASSVDYGASSSNGITVTNKHSFQLGLDISYDGSPLPGINGGGSYGFSRTDADSSSVNVTKGQSFDLNVAGNGDGVDHAQDFFVLLLGPSVKLQKHGGAIQWDFTDGGSMYEVFVQELRQPASMRSSTAAVLHARGFTNADYQAILDQDPFGGKVCTASALQCSMRAPQSDTVLMAGDTPQAAANDGLDPHRFWLTGQNFPYQPALQLPQCNDGLCNCPSISHGFTNDKLTDVATETTSETTVQLEAGVSVPLVYSLKVQNKMVWTTSATSDNSTASKQTATATLTCPSTAYRGPTGMKVYWDTLYGSFVFVPYDPGVATLIHQGTVVDAGGHPVAGQSVTMTYAGKTQRTFTAPDGSYRFPSPAGKSVARGTAKVVTGGLTQTITVGAGRRPSLLRMRQMK